MRIAQITFSYKPITGGADVYAALLHRMFVEAAWESVVYQAAHTDAEGEEVRLIPEPPAARALPRFWRVALGLPRLRAELAGYDVLVAHYANYHRPVAWHPCTVLISHGVSWDDRPWALRSVIKRAMARRAYREARAVVANDTFFLREMGRAVAPGAPPHREVEPGRWFIPNGVDTERFSPGPSPTRPSPDRILVPRNLYRNRGIHLAIEAMALLAEDSDAVMEIAGAEGQPAYAAYCRERVARLGLGERVRFLGPTPWPEMPDLYRRSAVTLIPTLRGEGSSLAALESMACGTPCVGTSVAGLLDLPVLHAAPTAPAVAAALREALATREDLAARQRDAVLLDYAEERWRASWRRVLLGARAG